YNHAIAVRSSDAALYFNRGLAWLAMQQHAEALADFDLAGRQPNHAEALHMRANTLRVLRRHEEAAASYAQAVSHNPDLKLLIGDVLHTQMQLCDWTDYAGQVQRILQKV